MIARFFDLIGNAITSLGAVIFVLLMVITGMIFFSHTLFLEVFPASMQPWEKLLATWVMALGWELTVLITTVNTKHINKRIPWLMAIASGVIVLFFIQAFDGSLTGLQITQRWFVGLLAAALNYIYADLFYAKWQERNSTLAMPKELEENRTKVLHLLTELDQCQTTFNQSRSKLNEVEAELKELRAFRKKVESELTCPHCRQPQPGYGTLRAHQGHCSKNPKNIAA
jgi:hypothetical protein